MVGARAESLREGALVSVKPRRHSTWRICRSLQQGQSGWMLHRRSGNRAKGDPKGVVFGTRLLWFADLAEAEEMKALLDQGLTVEEAYARQHARIDQETSAAYRMSQRVLGKD
jgi:hypothetical protein